MKRHVLNVSDVDTYASDMAAQFNCDHITTKFLPAALLLFIAGSSRAVAETGIASIYAYSTTRTANGERANPNGLTAAHRTLAFGTRVRVTHRHNGRSVTVRINDRGPFVRGRVIDLTPAGARALGFSGLAPVGLELAQN